MNSLETSPWKEQVGAGQVALNPILVGEQRCPARWREDKPAPRPAHEGHLGTATSGEVERPFVAPPLPPGSGVVYVMGKVNIAQLILQQPEKRQRDSSQWSLLRGR